MPKKIKNNTKKSKSTNNIKKIKKVLIPSVTLFIVAYIIYKIISLIALPTDIYMIENSTIYEEESATRICN